MQSSRLKTEKPEPNELDAYLEECRARLDAFTSTQFSWQGALRMRQTALKQDLLIAPLNVMLALPAVIARKIITFFERGGFTGIAKAIAYVPVGIKTGYQREVERQVWSDLFGLGPNVSTPSERDAALSQIVQDPDKRHRLHLLMEKELGEFFNRRAYMADLMSSGTTWGFAWFFYSDSSLGVWDIGRKLANGFAKKKAASDFFLGEGIGNAFYSVVPVEPTAGQIFWASIATLLFLSAIAVVASYLSEPIQNGLGIQKRQLNLLLDSLKSHRI